MEKTRITDNPYQNTQTDGLIVQTLLKRYVTHEQLRIMNSAPALYQNGVYKDYENGLTAKNGTLAGTVELSTGAVLCGGLLLEVISPIVVNITGIPTNSLCTLVITGDLSDEIEFDKNNSKIEVLVGTTTEYPKLRQDNMTQGASGISQTRICNFIATGSLITFDYSATNYNDKDLYKLIDSKLSLDDASGIFAFQEIEDISTNFETSRTKFREFNSDVNLISIKPLNDAAKKTFLKKDTNVDGETATDYSKRLGSKYLINASGWIVESPQEFVGIQIKDSQIISNPKNDRLRDGIGVKDDGLLYVVDKTKLGSEILAEGFINTWNFGPLLGDNGASNSAILDGETPYPRSVIFQEYDGTTHLMTVSGKDEGTNDGATLAELADWIYANYDTRIAYNFDGGGSIAMTENETLLNLQTDSQGQRLIKDVLYFDGIVKNEFDYDVNNELLEARGGYPSINERMLAEAQFEVRRQSGNVNYLPEPLFSADGLFSYDRVGDYQTKGVANEGLPYVDIGLLMNRRHNDTYHQLYVSDDGYRTYNRIAYYDVNGNLQIGDWNEVFYNKSNRQLFMDASNPFSITNLNDSDTVSLNVIKYLSGRQKFASTYNKTNDIIYLSAFLDEVDSEGHQETHIGLSISDKIYNYKRKKYLLHEDEALPLTGGTMNGQVTFEGESDPIKTVNVTDTTDTRTGSIDYKSGNKRFTITVTSSAVFIGRYLDGGTGPVGGLKLDEVGVYSYDLGAYLATKSSTLEAQIQTLETQKVAFEENNLSVETLKTKLEFLRAELEAEDVKNLRAKVDEFIAEVKE